MRKKGFLNLKLILIVLVIVILVIGAVFYIKTIYMNKNYKV